MRQCRCVSLSLASCSLCMLLHHLFCLLVYLLLTCHSPEFQQFSRVLYGKVCRMILSSSLLEKCNLSEFTWPRMVIISVQTFTKFTFYCKPSQEKVWFWKTMIKELFETSFLNFLDKLLLQALKYGKLFTVYQSRDLTF